MNGKKFRYDQYPLSFSPAVIFDCFFGKDAFIRCLFLFPFRTFFLLLSTLIPSAFITFAVMFVFMVSQDNIPWLYEAMYPYLKGSGVGFPAVLIGTMTVIAYGKYENGWYQRRPIPGVNDLEAAFNEILTLLRSIVWHVFVFTYDFISKIIQSLK